MQFDGNPGVPQREGVSQRISDIVDRVVLIENKSDHSIVHTKSGACLKAKHVVISTAFRRRVLESLTSFVALGELNSRKLLAKDAGVTTVEGFTDVLAGRFVTEIVSARR